MASISAVLVCSAVGCAERLSSSATLETGKNWAKGTAVEVDRLPNGHIRVEKDAFWERYVCIRNGKHIHAAGRHDCTKKGGKTYFEVIDEQDVKVMR